jgi:hypothetical protein
MSGQEVTPETPSVAPENPVSAPFQFPLRKPSGSHYNSAEALHTALQAENSGHYLWLHQCRGAGDCAQKSNTAQQVVETDCAALQ